MTDPGSWRTSLREHRFVEAAARARVAGEASDLNAALDDLAEVERNLRAKSYTAARRSLARYVETLDGVRDAHILTSSVDSSGMLTGLDALQAAESLRSGELEEMRATLAAAFRNPLTEPEAHNAMGVLHALRGEPDEARAEFTRALELDARHYRAMTNLGNLLLESGDPAGAEELYRRALDVNDEYAGAHHNLAVALRRQRKLAASVRSLKRSQRLSVRRANQEGRAEARDRMGAMGQQGGKIVRYILIAALVLVVVWLLRGAGVLGGGA